MNVRVARHFEVWIEEQVASGRFGDPSQVVEEALRLLEQREAKLADLRQAIQEGEASGPSAELDLGALRQRLHQAWDEQQKGQG